MPASVLGLVPSYGESSANGVQRPRPESPDFLARPAGWTTKAIRGTAATNDRPPPCGGGLNRQFCRRKCRLWLPFKYYPGSKEGHIPTRSASEGSGAFPSLALRVNMQQHAELPCRGNKRCVVGPQSTALILIWRWKSCPASAWMDWMMSMTKRARSLGLPPYPSLRSLMPERKSIVLKIASRSSWAM